MSTLFRNPCLSHLIGIVVLTVGILLSGGGFTIVYASTEATLQSVSVTDLVTDEYKQKTLDMIINLDIPFSSETIQGVKNCFNAWNIETFEHYGDELREAGATDENWIKFGSKMLWSWDNKEDHEGDKFQDYISREEIVDSVVAAENRNVMCDEDGPYTWVITADIDFNERSKNVFEEVIEWYKANGAADICESLRNNGPNFVFVSILEKDRGPDGVSIQEYGGITVNMNTENTKNLKDKNLRNMIISDLFWENSGTMFNQLMMALDYGNEFTFNEKNGYMEFAKTSVAGWIGGDLKGKDNLGFYGIVADAYSGKVESFIEKWQKQYGVTVNREKAMRLCEALAVVLDPVAFDSLYEVNAFNQAVAENNH